jgi:membrane-bound ClpP family serine protease
MKTFPYIALFGSGALITGIAAAAGIAPTLELKLLVFINTTAITGFLLRKHLGLYRWFYPPKKASQAAGTTASNTSWFVTNRLGLKRVPLDESTRESAPKKSRTGEVDKIVPVIEPIDPGTGGGKVKYKGMKWHARSSTRETIALGERVLIVGRDILTLVVERIEQT